MELSEKDALERLHGEGNLLNRLKDRKQPVRNISSSPPESLTRDEVERDSVEDSSSIPSASGKPPSNPKASSDNPPQNNTESKKQKILSAASYVNKGYANNGQHLKDRISKDQKVIAAVLGKIAGVKIAAQATGMSQSTVFDAMKGNIINKDREREPDEELRERIRNILPGVQDTALTKFFEAAGFVNVHSLEAIPLKERALVASQIMRHMINIVDRTLPPKPPINNIDNSRNAQVVVMTTPTKKEEEYETVPAVAQRIA